MTLSLGLAALALFLAVSILPRAGWRHAISFCACLLIVPLSVVVALGQPRPMWTVFTPVGKGHVVGAVFDEPAHIFLWVQRDGEPPVSYALPWSEQQAAQLQEAMQAAKKTGQRLEVARRQSGDAAEGGPLGALRFYAVPQRGNPPKTASE
jgi:hypothetical protein